MRLLTLLAPVLLATGAIADSPSSTVGRLPNIVIVMPDDVGYGDFSFTGNPVVRTPNIDRLARGGTRFRDFHVSPTCAPTRCALMTGRHEFKSGVTHTILERERMSPRAQTLAQMLRSSGYTTGIFGKWHLGDEPAYQPDKRGFDEVFIHGAGGIGQTYVGSCGDAPNNSYFDPHILHNGRFEKTKGYCTDVFFDQSIRWIDSVRKADRPFFAYITPNAAHAPLDCPEDYARRHEGRVGPAVSKFLGMIENIDDNVGRLHTKLQEWNLERDTLFIFLTDNGGTAGTKLFNAGMRGGKNTPYEGGTRVLCVFSRPGTIAADADVDVLTAHLDIFPTLAEIIGAKLSDEVRNGLEGRSLLPLLSNSKAPWPDRTFVTHIGRWPRGEASGAKHSGCSIRNERYALVNDKELFDLQVDPGQERNIIEEHPDVVARLRADYDSWWADALPRMENEEVSMPKMNPFKELWWRQYGGGPDEELRARMDPSSPRNRQFLLPRDRGDRNGGKVPRPGDASKSRSKASARP
ncbi:MAG: arylsulfatase [Isosphaeraceae bacterium]|nr:arylsulfatase [Isosphaeraceae bacterium]